MSIEKSWPCTGSAGTNGFDCDWRFYSPLRHMNSLSPFRRLWLLKRVVGLLATLLGAICAAATKDVEPGSAHPVTIPIVSEKACPVVLLHATAVDGHRVAAVLRKPPGEGPFPAIVFLHGGLNERSVERMQREASYQPTISRFLAAGFLVVDMTFRSRNEDPQSKDALNDCLAMIAQVKKRSDVEPKSVGVLGHSGGGSLALEVAGEADLCAIVAGEPASILFTGMYNRETRRREQRDNLMAEPKRYYTPQLQAFTREKIKRIACPVLIVQGDQHPINRINDEIVVPELRAAAKAVEVIVYPGQPHNFVFGQQGSSAAILKCYNDSVAFFKKHVSTQPAPLASGLVTFKRLDEPAGARAKRPR